MEELVLSQTQQQGVLRSWNNAAKENKPPPSISELIKSAFPDIKNADGRTKEGRAVRAFLHTRELKARTSRDPERELTISEEQKEFIKNNAQIKFDFFSHIIKTWQPITSIFSLSLCPNLFLSMLSCRIPTNKINRLFWNGCII